MDINELRIFRAVAQEGSITKAAQALGYVQSNVTARIQQLEEEQDTKLFYRQRKMILTPSGEQLLTYAEKILHLVDEAQKALQNTGEPKGTLRLGANHTTSALHLPLVFAQYHKAYPKVELSLTTEFSGELIDKIKHYELDAAFVKAPVNDPDLVKELLYEEELVLISNSDCDDIEKVFERPFLMNTKGCFQRELLESWLKSIGIHSVRYMEFNHLDAIVQGVISRLGASLVPYSVIQKYSGEKKLRFFQLPAEYKTIQISLIRKKDSLMTSAFENFVQVFKTYAPKIGVSGPIS